MKAYQPSKELESQLASLPDSPGVYFFKNDAGETIYIGKAVCLRSRVRSYWNTTSWRERPKLAVMVPRVATIETIITNSEKEALILEATLIRKHMPRYNVALKDDKRYPWLSITYDESFPRLIMVRDPGRMRKEESSIRVFGPYVEAGAMWETIKVLRRVFPMRQRRTPLFKDRPCMNYQIGLCLGPCQKLVDATSYNKMVQKVELFLSGRQLEVVRQLKSEMEDASEHLNFEQAAKVRNQIFALEKIIEKQQVFFDNAAINYDVLAEAHTDRMLCICLLRIREGKLISSEAFDFPLIDWRKHKGERGAATCIAPDSEQTQTEHIVCPENTESVPDFHHHPPACMELSDACSCPKSYLLENAASSVAVRTGVTETFQSFVDQYYTTCDDVNIPHEVVVAQCLDDTPALIDLLSSRAGRAIKVTIPRRGKKLALLAMAAKNAWQSLQKQIADSSCQDQETMPVLVKLKEELQLHNLPRRIECFDISNTAGTDNVSSMVVFENAQPKKADYRHFKIKSVEGQADDFASMQEAVQRRYSRLLAENKPLPDLVIIDGGKGQLNAALSALLALGTKSMDIIGLAKKQEEIYLPGQPTPVLLPRHSKSLHLLQRVRDEAHRFAVTFHRKLRAKRVISSEIDKLPGVGAARRKILLDHFISYDRIKQATLEELKSVAGIPADIAQAIYNSLHNIETTQS